MLGATLTLSRALVSPSLADIEGDMAFNRVATFPVLSNLPDDRDAAGETIAEIMAASEDRMTLIETDSEQEALDFVDITDPPTPSPVALWHCPVSRHLSQCPATR